ncbi:MAG TPA: S8 family peptidase [Thermoleophilaceae bacterium]|nr:S8 family peptidase [Thermoleophilaceae bacterium]
MAVACVATLTGVAEAAPGELIVRFEDDVGAADRAAIRDQAGAELERRLPVRGMYLFEVEDGRAVRAAERALERRDGVLYAEPNAPRRASLRPNDPWFPMLWGMENTGQVVRGVPGTADADTDSSDAWDAGVGGGVAVAVIDSGVDRDHPDLAPNAWRNPGESGSGRESNGLDDDLNGRVDDWRGWDFVANDADPADENGHGTHVAGTIAARRGNGIGVAGVADGSRILPLRVLDAQGTGSVAGVIQAYAYAARAGAKVVNLSLGSSVPSRAEQDAIAAFPSMMFVAAAGNGGDDGIGDDNDLDPEYPCAYPLSNVVCVAASDNRDLPAPFSNFGASSVDLAAPGVSIVSTVPGGGYAWYSGTSMATPHVAGAAAMLWAASPSATVSQIKAALLDGVDPAPAFAGRTVTSGRLNVLSSLRRVADVTLAPPAPGGGSGAGGDSDSGDGSGSAGGSGSGSGDGSGTGSGTPPGAATEPPGDGTPPPQPGGGGAAAGRDSSAPRLSVRVPRRPRIGPLRRRGLTVRVTCSEACSARLRLRVGRGISGTAPRVTLRPESPRRIVIRLGRGARARLGKATRRRATLSVRGVDGAGNVRTLAIRLRLRSA